MSNTKKKVKYGSYCAVLPTNEEPLSDDLFDLDENSIVYPSEEFDAVNRWDFDGVCNGPKEFLDSYKTSIAPLVQSVERGENAMVIFSGVPFMDPMEYLTTRNGRNGFISMAADQLIKSAIHGRQKMASVTFSWFKVECSSSEAITDLLRVASTPNTARGPDPNLVLREVGKGRGMFVSGLWEVELAAGSDVESVVAHVSKLVPGCAHNGTTHSVFQLTLTPVKQGGNASSSQLLLEDNGPSRLTFVQLSSLAPSAPPAADAHQPAPAVYPWVDQLSDLLVWMNARRPSPPFHKSRIMLLLRDAICGRMPGAMYFLMQPTVPAVSDNCLWLQLGFRIRDLIVKRTSAQPGQSAPGAGGLAQSSPGPAAASDSRSPAVSEAPAPPISSQLMYPATASPAQRQPSVSMSPSEMEPQRQGYGEADSDDRGIYVPGREARENEVADDEDDDMSFENLRRRSAEIAQRHGADAPPSSAPGGPGGSRERRQSRDPRSMDHEIHGEFDDVDRHYSSYNTSEDEPFQYLPSPPPPAPPAAVPEQTSTTGHGFYVNPFDELLAARGVQPAQFVPKRGVRESSPSRRRTASDASDMVHEALCRPGLAGGNKATPTNCGLSRDDEAPSRRGSDSSVGSARGGRAPASAAPPQMANGRQRADPSPSDVYLSRRDDRNAPPESADAQNNSLNGLEPSDLEALLEALHRSRQENKDLAESVKHAEERCSKLTREYERLVAKVQEEGYFLRAKEREKLRKAVQDLQDYEVYKQVMEAAMSKMQVELDLLIKENKAVKEDNVSHDRLVRKLKTESVKSHRAAEDLQRDAALKGSAIQDLEEKLATRTKERDAAVETLSHFKLKSSKHEGEMSSKIKSQETDIKELTTKLEEMTAKLEASETARSTLEDTSKQEVEKFRAAHLAALDKCMGYQEENDLLRASLSDIIEAQEQSIMNEELHQDKR